jgi:mannose-1-phosphate guanylyltransferase
MSRKSVSKTVNAYAVIMAGGKGERFWPLSTAARPKQFLSVVAGKALLGLAVDRLDGLIPADRILIVTGASLVRPTRDAVPSVPADNVIGEPVGRDTAAACACGTAWVAARDRDAVCVILTADQLISDLPVFHQTLRESAAVARKNDALVTLGIVPSAPSTGFGYVEAGEPFAHAGSIPIHRVVRFVEKPDQSTATKYIDSGRFFWNSGMFVWRAGTFLDSLKEYAPVLHTMAGELAKAGSANDFTRILEATYPNLPRISVDYAVMEKADNILMARASFGWDDVGAWPSVAAHIGGDASGNTLVGRCEVLDSKRNVVVSPDRLTALVGVSDLVVVNAPSVTMVCHRDNAQAVKRMVEHLRTKGGYDDVL